MGAPARLLVVDDEPRTAQVTAELLRRAGYAVDVALSGTEALSRVRSETPDLMLLDYEMPDMDAPEVLDQLRSGSDRLSFPVIIFTGARPSPGDQVLSIERGAADYIAKGTDRQVLLARVRGALRDRTPSGRALVRGRLRVDLARMSATLEGRELHLEGRPAATLPILAANPGEVGSDDERLAEITARGLRRLGFEADSSAKLPSSFGGAVPVVDLGILEGAGHDVLAAVRAARPIVVTGATDRPSRAMADNLAATDYLLKPVELDELAAAIKRRMK